MARHLTTFVTAILAGLVFCGNAIAQEQSLGRFFNQEWNLDPTQSQIYLQSVKNVKIFETHGFDHIEGTISAKGKATLKLDLASFNTGIDVRNVRMRFLFFQTFKFPHATISATLDKNRLQPLLEKNRLRYPLKVTLDLHGIKRQVDAEVMVTRIVDNAVSISSAKPIIVKAADFGLTGGIAKLAEAAGGVTISPIASITFDLVFHGADYNPQSVALRTAAAQRRGAASTQQIDSTACQTRLTVISQSRSIYFRTASADLDSESHALLDTVAQITSRCPDVGIEISGHTDSQGSPSRNQRLSERRARSVMAYLASQGVKRDALRAVGYGDTRPATSNNTAANRAKNRRIEFRIMAADEN